MMEKAIEILRNHIDACAIEWKDDFSDENDRELYAMISAINVLEIYAFGHHRTKYRDVLEVIENGSNSVQ